MAPIHDAVKAGDIEAVRLELEKGVVPDLRYPDHGNQFTPLILAVNINVGGATDGDCAQFVSLLLEAGADPSLTCHRPIRSTPLHWACYHGRVKCILMLLEAGASVHARTSDGSAPIDFVYRYTWEKGAFIYPLLLSAGSALPNDDYLRPISEDPYLRRIVSAGGFANYKRAHLAALAKTFAPQLAHLLPPETFAKLLVAESRGPFNRPTPTPSVRRPLDDYDHAGRALAARGLLPVHGGESDRAQVS